MYGYGTIDIYEFAVKQVKKYIFKNVKTGELISQASPRVIEIVNPSLISKEQVIKLINDDFLLREKYLISFVSEKPITSKIKISFVETDDLKGTCFTSTGEIIDKIHKRLYLTIIGDNFIRLKIKPYRSNESYYRNQLDYIKFIEEPKSYKLVLEINNQKYLQDFSS